MMQFLCRLWAIAALRPSAVAVVRVIIAETLEKPAQEQVPNGNGKAAENGQDQQDIEEYDSGAADRIEATHRVDRNRRTQHVGTCAIAHASAIRPNQRYGHALERFRALAMAGPAVAERLTLCSKLMRLPTRAN